MLSFLLPIEVIDKVITDFERDYCAQVYSSYIVDIVLIIFDDVLCQVRAYTVTVSYRST
jgi:hypothetical protein